MSGAAQYIPRLKSGGGALRIRWSPHAASEEPTALPAQESDYYRLRTEWLLKRHAYRPGQGLLFHEEGA